LVQPTGLDTDKNKDLPGGDARPEPSASAQDKAEESACPQQAGQPYNSNHFITGGERIHNEITYRGVDWLLNSAIGVTTAYLIARNKWGKAHIGEPLANFYKKLLKPVLRKENSVNEGAKWGTMLTSIMAGGTAIIPPMMVLENRKIKRKIICWLDEKIYGKDAVKNDPKFEQSYCRIEEEPKQDFLTGMATRFIALIPFFIVNPMPTLNKPLIKYLYDPIGNSTKWLAQKIGIKPGKMLLEGAFEHIEGDPNIPKRWQSNWDFLHRTIGFDFGLTVFYSIFHEITYKGLAALGAKKHSDNNAVTPLEKPQPCEEACALPEAQSRRYRAHPREKPSNHRRCIPAGWR